MAGGRHRSGIAVALLVAALIVGGAGCGGDEGGGSNSVSFFVFNEPSGAFLKAAQTCSEESNGRYRIEFEFLPADADSQREQLVRRLGAEDDSIDIIGMDVIWTAEFANAGWVREWTGEDAEAVTEDVFDSVVESASFEGKLYAAPYTSNTQLLWYRTDRVEQPPETWDEMLAEAERIGEQGTIQVQADRYEGLVVWANYMIESAGTEILSAPEEVALEQQPTETALGTMGRFANSGSTAANFEISTEDSARLGFETGDSSFMLNYPFVYPSAKEFAPEVFENMGATTLPRVVPDLPARPPLGGINLGISSYSTKPELAFEAATCLRQPQNQIIAATLGGLPPTNEKLYSTKGIKDAYPGFAQLIKQSIEDAAPRPQTPAYTDLSLAIQRALHPVSKIDPDDPTPVYEDLRDKVEQAVKREGLL